MRELRRFGIIRLAAVLCLAQPSFAPAATINVPADHPTIQAAINAAFSDLDEIVVAPGTYNECLNLLGKAITLQSSGGPAVTTIDGTGLNCSVITCESGETSATIINGFTVTNGTGNPNPVTLTTFGGGMNNQNSS